MCPILQFVQLLFGNKFGERSARMQDLRNQRGEILQTHLESIRTFSEWFRYVRGRQKNIRTGVWLSKGGKPEGSPDHWYLTQARGEGGVPGSCLRIPRFFNGSFKKRAKTKRSLQTMENECTYDPISMRLRRHRKRREPLFDFVQAFQYIPLVIMHPLRASSIMHPHNLFRV